MDKNYLVTKSNYFIMNSSYDLSLEEQKLILTLASMVQPEDEEFKPYIFKISDFMELLGVENQAKYTEIPKITKELMKKVFEIEEGNRLIQTAWLSGAIYEKGTGYVTLKFNPDLKPYMLKLNTMFTQYKLANILSMKSKYSPRIYEILKCNEFKRQGYIEIEVEELRKLLKADNIYPLYADFKRKIIFQTQKELKKISDISFDFEEIKTGRKVTALRFYIHQNRIKSINNTMIIEEVSATVSEDIELEREDINKIIYMMKAENIKELDAIKIYKAANGDINKIQEKYNLSKSMPGIKNIVGWMIKAIQEDYHAIKGKGKIDNFNNFEQRQYDFEDLERKLLGWDNEE
ncbi:MAG: replication initiation protein [Actinomyces sp.]|jgi:plasmid replication initiation protein|uniref:replication initiation protein n=2 Tax=Clostridium cadaveris TaxID=1529 RepID=UPI001E60889E|nr:replication initiation protein [Clostridium cadaveris]MDM8313572.1 replication initiation protein [Clostridium cadaveris]MDU5006915.1 replication initiation protein [Actinomyces sp.]UFH66754.1 replication initiation protein [Clostridium cadaveris]